MGQLWRATASYHFAELTQYPTYDTWETRSGYRAMLVRRDGTPEEVAAAVKRHLHALWQEDELRPGVFLAQQYLHDLEVRVSPTTEDKVEPHEVVLAL